jgi:hypothetical protein
MSSEIAGRSRDVSSSFVSVKYVGNYVMNAVNDVEFFHVLNLAQFFGHFVFEPNSLFAETKANCSAKASSLTPL